MKRNTRIWIYWREGVVKITIPFGEEITVGYGGRTDEGWSSYCETFAHDIDENTIVRTCVSDGCDCDGRLTSVNESHWTIGGNTSPMFEFDTRCDLIQVEGILTPDWESGTTVQRDYEAEAAGY